MIGYLEGTVMDKERDEMLVMVGGVGYRVRVDGKFEQAEGEEKVAVYVHTHVREDELTLYGFRQKKDLKMFELLIGVSGVGPKMAMNVMGKGTAEQVQKAVAMADVGFFTSVSGIGKKNAQRIIVDLKSKLGDLAELDLSETEEGDEVAVALEQMGFIRKEVVRVLRELEAGLSDEEKIRLAIKKLGIK